MLPTEPPSPQETPADIPAAISAAIPADNAPQPRHALSLALGQQLLIYTPDGPVGGTFTCTQCRVQAWQPALLGHAAGCLYHPDRLADAAQPHATPARQ